MVWCSVLFDKKNKLEKRFAIHALKFISKSSDSRSALRMVPILIMIHKPSFQIRAAFQLIFFMPFTRKLPSVSFTQMYIIDDCPLLAELLQWNELERPKPLIT